MTTTAAFGCVLHWPPTPRWEWVGREVNTSNARFRLHNSLFGILWIKTNNIEQTSFFRIYLEEPGGLLSVGYNTSFYEWNFFLPGRSIDILVPVLESTQRVKVAVMVSNWIGRTKVVWSENMSLIATNYAISE